MQLFIFVLFKKESLVTVFLSICGSERKKTFENCQKCSLLNSYCELYFVLSVCSWTLKHLPGRFLLLQVAVELRTLRTTANSLVASDYIISRYAAPPNLLEPAYDVYVSQGLPLSLTAQSNHTQTWEMLSNEQDATRKWGFEGWVAGPQHFATPPYKIWLFLKEQMNHFSIHGSILCVCVCVCLYLCACVYICCQSICDICIIPIWIYYMYDDLCMCACVLCVCEMSMNKMHICIPLWQYILEYVLWGECIYNMYLGSVLMYHTHKHTRVCVFSTWGEHACAYLCLQYPACGILCVWGYTEFKVWVMCAVLCWGMQKEEIS